MKKLLKFVFACFVILALLVVGAAYIQKENIQTGQYSDILGVFTYKGDHIEGKDIEAELSKVANTAGEMFNILLPEGTGTILDDSFTQLSGLLTQVAELEISDAEMQRLQKSIIDKSSELSSLYLQLASSEDAANMEKLLKENVDEYIKSMQRLIDEYSN